MFLARPLPESPEFGETGGAFINAWISHRDEAIAEQIARDAIAEEKWRVEQVEQQGLVSRDDYADEPDQLQHFDQAQIDGRCLVFHCWPPEGEDGDEAT
jgi:hypothetical protein